MPVLVGVVLAQIIALILGKLLAPVIPSLPVAQLILQGSFAAMAGRILKLPYWWVPINLLIPLLVALLLGFRF